MKERPILFSGPMVRAILDGRKTVTRRAVKVRGGLDYIGPGQDAYDVADPGNYGYEDGYGDFHTLDQRLPAPGMLGGPPYRICCPYGVPGDRLWVKETHGFTCDANSGGVIVYRSDGHARAYLCEDDGEGDPVALGGGATPISSPAKWKPPIYMPRWASRITLDVTEVRVQRLQAISEEDAKAEGVESVRPIAGDPMTTFRDYAGGEDPCEWFSSARDSFASLWRDINGPESWDLNPWVWAISFRRLP